MRTPAFLIFILYFANIIFAMTSKIPLQPYYDVHTLEDAVKIRDNFTIFRDEVSHIYKDFASIKNDMFFTDITYTRSEWTRLYLKWFDETGLDGTRLCPKSSAILHGMPRVKTAMFSVLKPGAKILPHKGPYRGCIRLHMGLITPNDDACFINVDGKSYSWRDGEVILLDDSYLHYVENNTESYRVNLFCDIERPMNMIGHSLNMFLMHTFSKYTHREN